MKKLLDINSWVDTPEKRMRLVRIAYLIALGMTVLGFLLIMLSYLYPDMLP